MTIISQKVQVLNDWGDAILSRSPQLGVAMVKSSHENLWFDSETQEKAINSIVHSFLKSENLGSWIRKYPRAENPKSVGIIMAGNLPLVGFHDLLCVIVSGHRAVVKLSDKDKHLLPAIIKDLSGVNEEFAGKVEFVDNLKNVDAVIATGSDHSAEIFEQYFADYPHIIRKNRNSLAVITGEETDTEMDGIARDIIEYYGLGCRSVSKIMVDSEKSRHRLFEALMPYYRIMDNERYANNYKYNYAVYMMNNEKFETNEMLIMKESPSLLSRIACLHYEYYDHLDEVTQFANKNSDKIQCIVSILPEFGEMNTVRPGNAQNPELDDYADNVDTRKFLAEL